MPYRHLSTHTHPCVDLLAFSAHRPLPMTIGFYHQHMCRRSLPRWFRVICILLSY